MNSLTKKRISVCLTLLILGCAANSDIAVAQQLKPIVGSKKSEQQKPAATNEKPHPEASSTAAKPAAENQQLPKIRSATEIVGPVQPATDSASKPAANDQDPPIITVTNQPDPILPAIKTMPQPTQLPVNPVVTHGQAPTQGHAPQGRPQYIQNLFANEAQSATPLRPFMQAANDQAETNMPPIVTAAEMNQPATQLPRMTARPAMPLPTANQELPPIVNAAQLHQGPIVQAAENFQSDSQPVPIVQAVDQNLPPVVQASEMAGTPMLQPAIVPAETSADELPPIVPSSKVVGQHEVAAQEQPVIPKGANFPEDAQQKIAAFIKANQRNLTLVQQPVQTAPEAEATNNEVESSETAEQLANDNTETAMPMAQKAAEQPGQATPMQAGANQPVAVPNVAEQIATVEQPAETPVASASYQPKNGTPNDTVIVNPRLQQFPNHQPIQPVAMPDVPVVSQPRSSRLAQAQNYSHSSTPIAQPYAPYPNQDIVVDAGPNVVGDAGQYFDEGQADVDVDVVVDYGGGENIYSDCGFCMDATNYFTFDTLIWHRAEGDFRAGNFTVMDEFDWNYGGRVIWGNRWDCAEGREFAFMAFDPWTARTVETNAAGGLIGAVFPGGGLGLADVSAFQFQTNYLEQWQKTELYSMEANRVWWGWDVAKTFFGFRYMSFDDKFGLSASNLIGQQGFYTIDATNEMFGLHAGGMANYDYGRKFSYTLSGDIGGYLDFMDGGQTMINGGNAIFANRVVDTNFAWSLQLGAYLNYKLAPRVRFKVGYEFMALYNVLTTEAAYRPTVVPRSGSSIETGNTLFHGGVLGFDFYR